MKAKFITAVLAAGVLSLTAGDSYGWNESPQANLKVFREYVIFGRSVILDGNDPCNPSYDPDGYITKYEWDFYYDGSFDCNYSETASSYPDGAFDGKTAHTYDASGTYLVMLKVTDNGAAADYLDDPCTVYVCFDEDQDNLPDDWEDLYGLDDSNSADADEDADSDGFNNLSEYLHGSEPDDGNSTPSFNITIYVPADVNSIQRAIYAAIDGDTIVVAKGTYNEVVDFDGKSCTLTSTDPNDWNVVAATIIDANDPNAEVVIFDDANEADSVLTGFTITGGNLGIYCEGVSPTISNCVIRDNDSDDLGGGLYDANCSPLITRCFFSGNNAVSGGGIYDFNSSPILISCVFTDNTATNGGAMYNYNSSPIVVNCTFRGNSSTANGGGMYSSGTSDPNVTNSIFWDNSAGGSGNEVYKTGSAGPNFSYSDIEDCNGSGEGWDTSFGIDGGGNIDSDPCFADVTDAEGPDGIFGTLDDGLRLRTISPCIDAADGNAAPSYDIAGRARIDVPYVNNNGFGDPNYADMGAYESLTIWFVDKDANGSNNGTSWEDAFTGLQDALAEASNGDEIWVAEGTYKPTSGSSRTISFQLLEGVALYGGFAGTETGLHQRNWIVHRTILSGDIGTPGSQADNSYHVVKGADDALLDGLTITGGYANSASSPDYYGAGVYCSSVSPTIRNCMIKDNRSSYGGGMYNTSSCPILINCVFSGNTAGYYGGGMYNTSSDPTLVSCVFSANIASGRASGYGGGICNTSSSPTLVNCTFSKNRGIYYGGAMSNYSSSFPVLTNCILWGDLASTGPEIYNSGSTPTVSYSDIQGGYAGTGNINSDPCFADANNAAGDDDVFFTYDDGLRIEANDVNCIDSANGNVAPLQDILGLDRIDLPDANNTGAGEPNYVDMGAYESYDGVDEDEDGIPDDYEKLNSASGDLNPNVDDDGDGLTNLEEYQLGTWANWHDTDGDGMPDGWEYQYGLDPLDASDATQDADNDTLTNLAEYQAGSDPTFYNAITVTVYQYDNAGDVIKETIQTADGNDVAVTQHDYDELGRRWRQRRWASVSGSSNANDIITLYAYDTRSQLKETVRKGVGETDPNQQEPDDIVTTNYYDSLGRIADVNDAEGGNTHYTYYAGGEPNQVTDPNGNKTTNYYDNAGRLEKVADEEGHYREYYYDSLGRTVKQIAYDKDENELMQTRFEYNGLGNVTRRAVMADADSTLAISTTVDMVTDYNYADVNGLLLYERIYYNTSQTGTTYYSYDELGRRTDVNDPAGNLTLLTYNEIDQITRRQQVDDDPIGTSDLTITTDYVYDSLGRVHIEIAKLDVNVPGTWQTTTYYYDVLGNRINEYRPNDVLTLSAYDALGRLTTKVADYGGIGQTTDYGYDRLGRQISISGYANGSTEQKTQYEYDGLDRITKITYPDGNDITYQYNAAGRVTRRNDQRGIVTTYAYDGVYNMTAKYVDGNGVTADANEVFTYDGLGRMLTAIKKISGPGQVSKTEFSYNGIGKVSTTGETLFALTKKTIQYTYDQAGYRKKTVYPWSSSLEINVTPDWQGRIDTLKLNTTTIATYDYIGSRVAQRLYPYSTSNVNYTATYDNLGRITSGVTTEDYAPASTIAAFDYEYDPNTNDIAEITYVHRDSNTVDYAYDNLDRLTLAEYSIDDSNEAFTIDDLGNRDSVNVRDGNNVNYDIDNLTNRYDSVGGSTLAYDAAGNLTADKDGYQYEYDYENRITKIIKSGPTTVAEFAYDALGRRIKKVDSVGGTTSIYYYNDKWQVLSEYNGSNSPQRWFAYGNYIDEVLVMNTSTSALLAKLYVHDHLFSPVALVQWYHLDLKERYEYDAYGNCQIMDASYNPRSSSLYGNPYYFTGRRLDVLDGGTLKSMHYRHRTYDTYTGRFLTYDPMGYIEGINLYEYGLGNPLSYIDPMGLAHFDFGMDMYERDPGHDDHIAAFTLYVEVKCVDAPANATGCCYKPRITKKLKSHSKPESMGWPYGYVDYINSTAHGEDWLYRGQEMLYVNWTGDASEGSKGVGSVIGGSVGSVLGGFVGTWAVAPGPGTWKGCLIGAGIGSAVGGTIGALVGDDFGGSFDHVSIYGCTCTGEVIMVYNVLTETFGDDEIYWAPAIASGGEQVILGANR